MSERTDDTFSAVAFAEWLQMMARRWTDPRCTVDVDVAHSELTKRLTAVKKFAERQECLSVKEALQLHQCGQELWNGTFLLSWPPERRRLQRTTRQLAAYLFLASHHVFAPPEVFNAHISHHLDDAEKCILMCLKVSKSLVNHSSAIDEADKMLAWAADILAACHDPSNDKIAQCAMEVHFAQLHVLWRSGEFMQACTMAEQLAQETKRSVTYREALFEFIFASALKAVCGADKAEEMRIAADGFGASVEWHDATQTLLSLSLRLQKQEDMRTVKQQRFLGMTELQLGCLLLRTGAYAEAVDAAEAAYEHLHTFEPLVVRLKAESLRHNTESVSRLFGALCSLENSVSTAELCAIATCVVESNPAIEEEISTRLKCRVASAAAAAPVSEEDRFRFLCFLLHVRSEWSVGELIRLLRTADKPLDKTFHRFLFSCLWRLAMCEKETVTLLHTADDTSLPCKSSGLSAELKWQCLRLAVSEFSQFGSSDAERQSVLLDMSMLAIEMKPNLHPNHTAEGDASVDALQHTWDLWRQESTVHPALLSSVLVAQAQLAFLLGRPSEGLQRVRDLWSSAEEEDTHVRSCATLINFLITRSMFDTAGSIAQYCLPHLASQSPPCILDFAKVCALGSLANDEEGLVCTVADLLVAHVCPLLASSAVAVSSSTAAWWSRFLWYVSDRLLEGDTVQAVRLSYTAVCLLQKPHTSNEEQDFMCGLPLLHRRVCALLEAEFDLYVGGQPSLTVAELQQLHTFFSTSAESNSAEDNCCLPEGRREVALALTNIELVLRQLEDSKDGNESTVESLQLASLPSLPSIDAEDMERVAKVCHRVGTCLPRTCTLLCAAAVSLQIAAAEAQCRHWLATGSCRNAICTVLSMLYDAYGMSNSTDTKAAVFASLMRILSGETTTLLTKMVCTVLKSHSFDDCSSSEHDAGLVEAAVEFFAVEAWNESVQWNVVQRRVQVETWRGWALTLADMLDSTNASRVAIADFSIQMPLL